ncbi:hypothetical protein R9X47_09080 [Wukongibacter baidiensis]|uniref:hypothetical protein n=1 Tax=Wukongibacter baidiensis TaxID=1723361 RepID=UPI003D7F7A91
MVYLEKALEEVAEELKSIFGATAEGVAKVVKAEEHTAEDVAKGIKRAYNKSDEVIAYLISYYVLSYAGYNTGEIVNALMDTF